MSFDTWQNRLKLTIDSSKIDEDLTNFPVLISLSSGTGITNYDVTDVFDKLEPTVISGTAVSGTYDDYIKLMLHMDGDASDSQHTVTVNGNPQSYATGVFNGSMYFDGTGDYLTIPDSSDWDFGTGDFTIDFWTRLDSISGYRDILNTETNSYGGFDVVLNDGQINFSSSNGVSSPWHIVNTSSFVLSTSIWYHIAVVRNGTDIKIYVNGTERGSGTNNDNITCSKSLWIANQPLGRYLYGNLDELRISKGIARWTSNFTPPTEPYTTDSDTVLLLHMDGDQSLSQHTFTFNGNPEIYSSEGEFNGSYKFSSDYLQLADHTDWNLGTDDFTLDCWINLTSIPGAGRMISRGDVTSNNGRWTWGVGTTWGGGTKFNFADCDSGVHDHLSSALTITTGIWYHAAVVRDSNTLRFFLNGIDVGTTACSHELDCTDVLYVGCRSDPGIIEYFPGYIDELRFSKGVARWTSNFIPPTGPYGSSWDNRKKIAITTVASPGIYDHMTKLMLHMDGDASDSQHTVTVNGNPQSYATGVFNGSMYFDGNDYLQLADSSDWDFGTGDFTIETWFKRTVDDEYQTIYSNTYNNGVEIYLTNAVGTSVGVRLWVKNSYYDFEGSYTPDTIMWHHLALTRSSNSTKCFIDGVQQGSAQTISTDISGASEYLRIGTRVDQLKDYFTGYLDEYRVSKGIARWTSNFTPPTEPYTTDSYTKLLLHMDGDQSLSQHTFTFNGNPEIYSSAGKFDGSMYFDGNGDYLNLGSDSDWNFGSEVFTIDFWMYATSNSDERDGIVCIQNGAVDIEIHIGLGTTNWGSSGNNICLAVNYSGGWGIDVVGSINVCDSTWHHVATTKSGTSWKTYIDGVEDISTTYDFSPSAGTLLIGAHITTDRWFNGYIDELRISKGIVRWTTTFSGSLPTSAYARSTGEVQLPVELEYWDNLNEKAWLWTQIPTIASGTDTDLYLYYDKDQNENSYYIGDTGEMPAKDVWDNNFKAVYHMSQDPSGGSNAIKDSTSNAINGTANGSMNSTDLVNGIVGNAIDFDGSDDSITLGTIAVSTAWTAEVIAKPVASTQSGDGFIVFNGNGIVQGGGYWALLKDSDCQRKGNTLSTTGDFLNIAASYDGTSTYYMYENGVENSSSYSNTSWGLSGAYYIAQGYSGRKPEGIIDEIRVSDVDRSAAWVKSTYYSNWNNLITFSEVIPISFIFSNPVPTDGSTQYGYRHLLKITVTTTGIAADSYVNDITFYDGADNKIGNTLSGVNSGSQATSTDYYFTPTAGTNSWYVYSTASGHDATSSTYSFDNLFLCAGYTEVDGVRTSGIPVRLYKRSDGSMLGEAITSGVSGTFEIPITYTGYCYAVALHPTDDYRNAEIYDWLAPVVS